MPHETAISLAKSIAYRRLFCCTTGVRGPVRAADVPRLTENGRGYSGNFPGEAFKSEKTKSRRLRNRHGNKLTDYFHINQGVGRTRLCEVLSPATQSPQGGKSERRTAEGVGRIGKSVQPGPQHYAEKVLQFQELIKWKCEHNETGEDSPLPSPPV